MKKKLLALLLCLVMALSMIPAMSYADNIVEGTNWYLDRDHCLHLTGMVTNSSTIATDNTPWKNYKSQIVSVVAENGAAIINGTRLFQGCTNLTAANLSKLNTAPAISMYMMFSGCNALKTLDLSNFSTDKVTTMVGMFENCSSLTSLNISSFSLSETTSTLRMFVGCSNLNELIVNPSVLAQTADQLMDTTYFRGWRNKTSPKSYKSADELRAITEDSVTLVRTGYYYVTFDTPDGVKVQYGSDSTRLYGDGEYVLAETGSEVRLYAMNIPSGMVLDEMTTNVYNMTVNSDGSICRYFTMPQRGVTVTVTLKEDQILKGKVSVSGECFGGSTLTASVMDSNGSDFRYQWFEKILNGSFDRLLGEGETYTVPEDFLGTIYCQVSAANRTGTISSGWINITNRIKHTLTFEIPYGAKLEYNGQLYISGDSIEVCEGTDVSIFVRNLPEGTVLDAMVLNEGTSVSPNGNIGSWFHMPDHDVTLTVQFYGTPTSLPGDVDDSGTLTEADLTALLRHVAKIEVLTDDGALSKADYNRDGIVDALDVTLLARVLGNTK